MKRLKPIFNYLIWILIAMILGIVYMRLLLGEMHQIVTSSQHVSSRKILDAGFQFQYASLSKSLQNLLK